MRRFLHLANGSGTTNGFEAAGIPGASAIFVDLLYEGPVPAGLTDEELLEMRARYLAGPAGSSFADLMKDWRSSKDTIEKYASYDELVLWFEHDLFDQLNLIRILSWISDRLPAEKVVSLVCIGSFPGRARFMGLGELTPRELGSLLERRQPVGAAQYDLAERAWRAFRESTPSALDALRATNTSALPFLAAAVTRFLQEYPSTIDGLSRTERRLLELADPGPADLRAAFPRMHDGEDAYYITDGSFTNLVESLSSTAPPLVTRADGANADSTFSTLSTLPRGTMTITDTGRAVLRGQRDRVRECGIDRWLGGVHLTAGAASWRWDDKRARMRRS